MSDKKKNETDETASAVTSEPETESDRESEPERPLPATSAPTASHTPSYLPPAGFKPAKFSFKVQKTPSSGPSAIGTHKPVQPSSSSFSSPFTSPP